MQDEDFRVNGEKGGMCIRLLEGVDSSLEEAACFPLFEDDSVVQERIYPDEYKQT